MSKDSPKKADYKRTEVYLEDRYEKPKHMFKVIADKLDKTVAQFPEANILDVGGATGELAYFLKQQFPKTRLTCLDSDLELVERGQAKTENISFVHGDANDMSLFDDNSFEIVTMIGVMTIFDDFRLSLGECLRLAKNTVMVISVFNEHDVDVLVKWRYSGDEGAWNPGYNMFSKKTVGDFLDANPHVSSWSFEKFLLPFKLERRDDVVRTWTEERGEGIRILRNGVLPEVNLQILMIELDKNQA
ncbi:MAG: class I SAM-dependent methyltransferase [Phototrophicaceae bacterium]